MVVNHLQNDILVDEAPYYHSIDIYFTFTIFTSYQLVFDNWSPMMGGKEKFISDSPRSHSCHCRWAMSYNILPRKALTDEMGVINLVFLILCL